MVVDTDTPGLSAAPAGLHGRFGPLRRTPEEGADTNLCLTTGGPRPGTPPRPWPTVRLIPQMASGTTGAHAGSISSPPPAPARSNVTVTATGCGRGAQTAPASESA